MKSIIHPSKAFVISQQFHDKCGRREYCHSWNESGLMNEEIQTIKTETKACVHYFLLNICINISDKSNLVGVLPALGFFCTSNEAVGRYHTAGTARGNE
jgi:hypothetical protein